MCTTSRRIPRSGITLLTISHGKKERLLCEFHSFLLVFFAYICLGMGKGFFFWRFPGYARACVCMGQPAPAQLRDDGAETGTRHSFSPMTRHRQGWGSDESGRSGVYCALLTTIRYEIKMI